MTGFAVDRYEWKYLISQKEHRILSGLLAGVFDADPHAGPDGAYPVRSLYFDTPDQYGYHSKMEGLSERRKIRLRIYDVAQSKVKLELKAKGLAIGLSAGTGAYVIAVIGTMVMTLVVLAFHVTARDHGASYLLVVKGEAFSTEAVTRQVKAATRRQRLKMQNTSLDAVECVFEVKIRPASEADIVKSLRAIEGVRVVNLISYHGEIGG